MHLRGCYIYAGYYICTTFGRSKNLKVSVIGNIYSGLLNSPFGSLFSHSWTHIWILFIAFMCFPFTNLQCIQVQNMEGSLMYLIFVKILHAKLEYQHSIQLHNNRIYKITERNSITRSIQIYPRKTLKGKTRQEKLPQYRW